MEVVYHAETSKDIYEITRFLIPEDNTSHDVRFDEPALHELEYEAIFLFFKN
jgi:hypothetical protein